MFKNLTILTLKNLTRIFFFFSFVQIFTLAPEGAKVGRGNHREILFNFKKLKP